MEQETAKTIRYFLRMSQENQINPSIRGLADVGSMLDIEDIYS
jgi:hypothetical protein